MHEFLLNFLKNQDCRYKPIVAHIILWTIFINRGNFRNFSIIRNVDSRNPFQISQLDQGSFSRVSVAKREIKLFEVEIHKKLSEIHHDTV